MADERHAGARPGDAPASGEAGPPSAPASAESDTLASGASPSTAANDGRAGRRGPLRRLRPWFFFLVLLLGAAAVGLAQTQRGQELVLQEILDRIRPALAGELTVAGIRSGTLLTGATVHGVTLTAAGDRDFLYADSLRLRYSLVGFATGRPSLRSVTAWGLDVEISQLEGEDEPNVSRLLAPGSGEATGAPGRVRIGRIGVRGGTVQVLTPARPGRRGPTVPAPGGQGRLARLGFDGLDLDLEDVTVRPGAPELLDARLASLSMELSLLDEPVRIEEAFAAVSFGRSGLHATEAAFRLPDALVRGRVGIGPQTPEGPWVFSGTLATDGIADLSALRWVDARIPEGTFEGSVDLRAGDALEMSLHDVEVELEASSLRLDGGVRFDDRMSMDDLRVTASPLVLDRLEPWTERPFPFDGWLSGDATFSGTFTDLAASGRMTLVPTGLGATPTTADFGGRLHFGDDPGATAFEARLSPLNYRLLELLVADLRLSGTGEGSFELSGRASEGLRTVADFSYHAGGHPQSRVSARGGLRRTANGEWIVDVQGDLAPLSLGALGTLVPKAELDGALAGPIRAAGPLRDLQVTGDLQASAGTLRLEARLDVTDPGAGYRVEATVDAMPLSEVARALPDSTEWTGKVALEGAGLRADSLRARARVTAERSRLGRLLLDTVHAEVSVADGLLSVDSVAASVGGVHISGSGRLGLAEGRTGSASLDFSAPTLLGLRPLFMGGVVHAGDTLNFLEEELLRVQGIDPEELPDTADVRMAGRLRGHAELSGSVSALDVDLAFTLLGGAYRHNGVDSTHVTLTARGLPTLTGEWTVRADATGLTWENRSFDEAHVQGEMTGREGTASVALTRRRGERYTARGAFELDSVGGRVRLDAASATLDSLEWTLTAPAQVVWDTVSVDVDALRLHRAGVDPMTLEASGTLSRADESDFRLRVEGVHLDRVAHALQYDAEEVRGHVDLTLDVRGSASDPRITGSFDIEEPRYGALELARVGGAIEYRTRAAEIDLEARDAERVVFRATGTLPLDLSLADVPQRVLDAPMTLSVRADSLDAAVALAYLTTLEDVEGTLSAEFEVGGTPAEPEPRGVVRLRDGAWTVEALGVRHANVNGTLTLNPDRTVEVDLSTSTAGRSDVRGTVTLSPVTDPRLDLAVGFAGFQAIERRDVEGRISGDLRLTGSYRRPVVSGDLRVDRGTLYIDEFARSATVVDLTDPRLFENVIDTTFLSAQPLIADLRNPFLQNLRVQIDLSVPRDAWLRSNEMNVEMGGELLVSYDRAQSDLVLVGELEALRGTYALYGRQFTVTGGTVGFPGTPGINPTLDIQTTTRIRRVNHDPIDIQANVAGTLTGPRLEISSDEAGLAQSDLLSYLWFGRSTSELSTGEEALVSGAAGAFAGAAIEGGFTILSGTIASQVGSALARGFGIDYLSITQAGDFSILSGRAGSLAGTQVEVGQYVGENAFIVLIFRPLAGQGAGSADFFGGARLELALNDQVRVEGFIEDRALRSRIGGFGDLGFQASQIVGVFVFREWGY